MLTAIVLSLVVLMRLFIDSKSDPFPVQVIYAATGGEGKPEYSASKASAQKTVVPREKNEEVQSGEAEADKVLIDINTAPKELLMDLPGVGPKLADAIINYREKKGPFKSEQDLNNVPGIGDKKFQKMEPMLKKFGIHHSPENGKAGKKEGVKKDSQGESVPTSADLPETCPFCAKPMPVTKTKYPHLGPYCPNCLKYIYPEKEKSQKN